jgi:hypothetical protein
VLAAKLTRAIAVKILPSFNRVISVNFHFSFQNQVKVQSVVAPAKGNAIVVANL